MRLYKKIRTVKKLSGDCRAIGVYSLKLLKKHSLRSALSALISILVFISGISLIYLARAALDKGIFAGDMRVFLMLTLAGFGVFVFSRIMRFILENEISRVKKMFSRDLNYEMTRRFFGLEYGKIKRMTSSENAFVMDVDHNVIEGLVFEELPALASVAKIPVYFFLAAMLSWPLALIPVIVMPLAAAHTIWASGYMRRMTEREVRCSSRYNSLVHDLVLNVKALKTAFLENWALCRVRGLFAERAESKFTKTRFHRKTRLFSDIMLRLNMVFFWMLGGVMIINGDITFGTFSAVLMYATIMASEVITAGALLQSIAGERSLISRAATLVKEVLARDEKKDRAEAREKCPAGDIVFRGVSFGYGPSRRVLDDVSFEVKAGRWTLMKGASGEGKTTLVSLFLRLYDGYAGKITLGGRDIRRIHRSMFFNCVSAVHQEPCILNDTLKANILMGADESSVPWRKAAECAGLGALVDALPMGYNTELKESGLSLSGGQRQRIVLARAIARDPRILILDEATSFIDTASEKRVLSAIKENYPGLTVLFITHREGAAIFADDMLLLSGGRVKVSGSEAFVA